MSVAAEGGEDVNGKVAANVVRGLVEGVDGRFDVSNEFDDVSYRKCPVGVVVSGVTFSLDISEDDSESANCY